MNKKNYKTNLILAGAFAAGLLAMSASTAHAIPKLQLYIEGADYDTNTDTWVVSGGTMRLWAIGNVGAAGQISNVRLSAAYADGLAPTISLAGSTIDPIDFPTMTDPSNPGNPSFIQTVTDGSAPLLGDGSDLPSHGIYGSQTDWQEFLLGDVTLTDSNIGDWNGLVSNFPLTFPSTGQINVYDVVVDGLSVGETVHFDLYDGIASGQDVRYIFAPFSHDAEGGGDGGGFEDPLPVPEPGGLALVAGALLLFAASRRRWRV